MKELELLKKVIILQDRIIECDGSEVNSRNSRKECIVFLSKEQYDWGQFKKPWLK